MPFVLSAVVLVLVEASGLALAEGDIQSFDRYVELSRVDWEVPGMAVAIVKDGRVLLAKGYGVREMGTSTPVDSDTLFAIASNTKAFTAAALAILVDEGRMRWDDRVRLYLPGFEMSDPLAASDMRIRDLLCHRSGLGTFSGDLLWYGTSHSRDEVVRRVRFLKPSGIFRSTYGYSNVMFITAGQVIEAVSGRRWEEFVKARIFDRLGMTRTRTSIDELGGERNLAAPHGKAGGKLRVFPWYSWDSSAAAGGIISSAGDMAKWLILQAAEGEWMDGAVFSREASRTMLSPHTFLPTDQNGDRSPGRAHFRAYGLGWNLFDYHGRLVANHGGAYDGMYSRAVFVPEERLGLVVLTNAMTDLPIALMYRFLDEFLDKVDKDWSAEMLERSRSFVRAKEERVRRDEAARLSGTEPSLSLTSYTGTYGGPLYGDASVSLEDGRLVLRLLPAPDFVADLSHWHLDTFELTWRKEFPWFGKGKVNFLLDQTGTVSEMKIDVPNEDFWFQELEFKRK